MKKILFLLILLIPLNVFAESEINVYFFHADGCHNCEIMDTCIKDLETKYALNIIKYQVRGNEENMAIMNKVKSTLTDKNISGVPFIALGNKYVHGGSENKCKDLEDIIDDYSKEGYVDVIGSIINDTYVSPEKEEVLLVDSSSNTEEDKLDILKEPKLIIAIILIIVLLVYYFTSSKEGAKKDEKKQ